MLASFRAPGMKSFWEVRVFYRLSVSLRKECVKLILHLCRLHALNPFIVYGYCR